MGRSRRQPQAKGLGYGDPCDVLIYALGAILVALVGIWMRQVWQIVDHRHDAWKAKQHTGDVRGVTLLDWSGPETKSRIREFVERNEPFVCRSCSAKDHLEEFWRSDDSIVDAIGKETKIPVRSAPRDTQNHGAGTLFQRISKLQDDQSAYDETMISLADFVEIYSNTTTARHSYAGQVDVLRYTPDLLPFIQRSAPPGEWLEAIGETPPISHRPLSMYWGYGPLTTPLHYDSLENMVCLVRGGTKEFTLVDPAQAKLFLYIDRSKYGNGSPVGRLTPTLDDEFPLTKWILPVKVTLHLGDCLYLPVYWYHSVSSSADEATISLNWWRQPQREKMSFWEAILCDKSLPGGNLESARSRCS